MRRTRVLFYILLLISSGFLMSCRADVEEESLPNPKNIIFFVGDGMGFNHVLAANYYQHGEAGSQVYEQNDWLQLAQATYMAADIRDGDTVFMNGYAPRTAWEEENYLATGYTDSGAAGTALSTGNKTVGGFIGIGLYGDTLTHISQAAKAAGKSKGIVTSVPLSHATPAAFVAHNEARHNYEEIGRYMLFHSRLDVLMGAGHPGYNDDGVTEEISARYPGGDEIWEQLASNEGRTAFSNDDQQLYVQDVDGDGQRDPWTLIESREDFLDMASGPAPKRVIGIPQVYSTLNYGRSMEEEKEMPFTQPFNENVPTLEEMTRASINILSQEDEGFFLMVEGGAIDWAGHDNHLGRMIEEMTDFNHSIEAAVEWVEENSSWEETLIIVTSDHETGYLTGPNHPEPVNDPVVNRGQGNLPEVQWNSGGHTNMLVPFYAKGPGTEMFTYFADEKDPVRGPFLQNTDIPNAIFLMWGRPDIELHRLNE
ncbi:MAG: alkaline phosphatase [Bacteroidales bacterium]